MSRLARIVALVLVPGVLGAGVLAASRALAPFPHSKHEKLFPICEGCHTGVTSGVPAELYPDPVDCAECHDGDRVRKVEWRRPGPRASNMRFSHVDHLDITARAGDTSRCQSCHAAPGAPSRMNVGGPRPELCLQCHAHKNAGDVHLAETANCATCHRPLALVASLTTTDVAAFPKPPWHDVPDFLSSHGRGSDDRAASCVVCHARETCDRCHANGDRVPLIAELQRDARVDTLEEGKSAEYPTPATHDERWPATHGAAAKRDAQTCSNCHTQPSCEGCHRGSNGPARAVIAAQPVVTRGGARGVSPARMTASAHPPDMASRHGTLASTGRLQCGQCHSQATCTACHSGTDSRAFHAANFVERHANEVFAGRGSCQSCHSTERFCRDCHARSGIASQSGMNSAFHTSLPNWVLSHGQAARTGMEACASCHRQTDCMRCHSASSGWGVNPHGPGFPASRLASRSGATCRWCHSSTPSGGS